MRKVSVIAIASQFFVVLCTSSSEKWVWVDSLFMFMWPSVKMSILGGGADVWTSKS